MTRTSRFTLAFTLLVALALPAVAAEPAAAEPSVAAAATFDARAEGRRLTELFRSGEADAVWERMTERMRGALGGEASALAGFRTQLDAQLGAVTGLVEEEVEEQGGATIYYRVERFEKAPMEIVTQWAFDGDGKVAGFFVRPKQAPPEPAESPHLDYETKADLTLPFDGEWSVFWGGRTAEQNYHVVTADQRFAYDFLVMENGSSHTGDGLEASDYHCWGRPILAPAPGKVVTAVDGNDDQTPGEMDPAHAAGNHVILDLGDGEYALLAHLQKGSVAVADGDAVERGQQLGLCGNSGNTSEPHLHFHLQDGPVFHQGKGLPAFFNHYTADGEPVERGEPTRGQTVAPRAAGGGSS